MMRYGILAVAAMLAGCAEQSADKGTIIGEPTSAVAFNVAGAPTVEFNVPDMMCPEGCGAKTKEILSGLPGAKEVVINFEAKTATVAIEEGKFDPAAAVATLKDYGFEHSSLKLGNAAHRKLDEVAEEPAS